MNSEISFNNRSFTWSDTGSGAGSYENHCHTELEIILILRGKARFIVEEKTFSIQEPCAVFLLPAAYHSVYPEKGEDYERICCMLPRDSIPPAIGEEFRDAVKRCPVVVNEELNRAARKIRGILREDRKERFAPYLQALVCELFYLAIDQASKNVQYEPDTTINGILRYIGDHSDRMIGINDIAEALFLSPSSVSHIFRKHMNISVKQYILQKKMLLADRYLTEGLTALEVSRKLGYSNYSNFCQIYRKIRGRCPKKDPKKLS